VGTGDLVDRLRAGDQDAFAELYDEFGDRIYGLCVSVLRDPHEAADVKHDTFVIALQRIDQLRDPARLKPWMFAIARHLCFRRLKQRERTLPVEHAPEVIVLDDASDVDPESAAELVWLAAGGLSDRDRAVLALNLIDGLNGPDLAAALGVAHANPNSLLSRAKARLERSVGVLLVATLGRQDCATLDELLPAWEGTLTPQLRKRLARHVDGCTACGHTRTRLRRMSVVSSLTMLAPAARAEALAAPALFEIAAHAPMSEERWLTDGFPPHLDELRRRRRALLVAVGIGVLGVILLFGVNAGSDARSTPPLEQARMSQRVAPTTSVAPSTTTAPTSTTTTTASTPSSSAAATPTTAAPGPAPTAAPMPPAIQAGAPPGSTAAPHSTGTAPKSPPPTSATTLPPATTTTSTTIRF
jgi:RNA polymerase sigma factor (sigma-70 family)